MSTITEATVKTKKVQWFWTWVIGSVILRPSLVYFPKNLNLFSRPEVSTPLTSIRRLAEGYWLKQSSMSPYADVVTAMLICAAGKKLQVAYGSSLQSVGLHQLSEDSDILPSGDFAAFVYLWNPFTIFCMCWSINFCNRELDDCVNPLWSMHMSSSACCFWVGHSYSFVSVLGNPYYPCSTDVWFMALMLPPGNYSCKEKILKLMIPTQAIGILVDELVNEKRMLKVFSWRPVVLFLFWALLWSSYLLILCGIYVQQHGGLQEMFKRSYGFILTIQDLSPNIGVFWYFFAEVFDFFRSFFLIVFHGNILLLIVPLAIRLNHRPCFLAFVYIVLSSMLKSYPSICSILSSCFLVMLEFHFLAL